MYERRDLKSTLKEEEGVVAQTAEVLADCIDAHLNEKIYADEREGKG